MTLPAGGHGSRRHWGIRARVTLLATLVVAGTLVVGGVSLSLLLRDSLVAGIDSAQLSRAQTVAAQAAAGAVNPVISATANQSSLVQIIDSTGAVIGSTANIHGEPPVLARPPAPRQETALTLADNPLDAGGDFRVQAEPVMLQSGPGWVYVAGSLSQVDAATTGLLALFAVGLPIVLLIVGFIVWRAVSQALRPVDHITQRASAIGAVDLSQRVPVPKSRDEIARLALTMNEMLSRLEAASTRQNQFIGDASHELRSPLAALRAQVDVARAHPDPSDTERVFSVISDQVDRMIELTADLLYLARATEGGPPARATLVDLDEIVFSAVSRLRESSGLTISLDVMHAARVAGSPGDLARVLRNLTDNARLHAHSEIRLALTVRNGFAEISVTDDGSGVPLADRHRLFERFTRLDAARPRESAGGGFGLGLAIARQIVLLYDGTLTVHDRVDGRRGATFIVSLPLAE